MTTVTVTPAQAQRLARAIADAEAARLRYADMVATLAAGHVPDHAVFQGIDTDTGVMSFHVETPADTPPPPAEGTPDAC